MFHKFRKVAGWTFALRQRGGANPDDSAAFAQSLSTESSGSRPFVVCEKSPFAGIGHVL